ncbi:hypothetical protein [Massilia sp.]|uniref:hypothetical protein n=1 Tax=Massilia sp. TaxID=1882437 RepID=UPI00352FAB81
MKMKIKHFGNSDITSMDCAECERKAAVRSINDIRLHKTDTTSIWGIDVARSDARSVGAWLDGRGDMRVAWWTFYSCVYIAVVPGTDLERTMYSFHRMHHAITLLRLRAVTLPGIVFGYVTRFVVRHLPVLG